jgi:hypothetical protein
MLLLTINGDEYRLQSGIKNQMRLKKELLYRYKGSSYVKITDNGKVIDELLLEDLFCEPIERIRNAGLTLPGK